MCFFFFFTHAPFVLCKGSERTDFECLAVFILAQNDAEAAMFETQLPTIIALTKGCKSAKLARTLQDVPAGCGSAVLSPTVAVHLLVKVRPLLQNFFS